MLREAWIKLVAFETLSPGVDWNSNGSNICLHDGQDSCPKVHTPSQMVLFIWNKIGLSKLGYRKSVFCFIFNASKQFPMKLPYIPWLLNNIKYLNGLETIYRVLQKYVPKIKGCIPGT